MQLVSTNQGPPAFLAWRRDAWAMVYYGVVAVLRTMAAGGVACLLLGAPACDSGALTAPPSPSPSPSPSPTPSPLVVPVFHTGPLEMAFESANIPPGSIVSGCGPRIAGCAGRLRITYRVRSAVGGTALFSKGFLYATNQLACLKGSTGPLTLPAQQDVRVEVTFHRPDVCPTPTTIRAMAFNVEGTVEIATRQEWTIPYEFRE